MLNEKAPAR